jgi:hypothetical protein
MQADAEATLDHVAEIDPPPAPHAILVRVGTFEKRASRSLICAAAIATEDAAERGAFRPGQRSVRGPRGPSGAGCRRRLREDYRPTIAKQTLSRELMSLDLRDCAQRFRSIGFRTRIGPESGPRFWDPSDALCLEQRIVRRADNRVPFSARCASKKTFV